MIIDLALEKGMRESPLTQDTDKSADEDPWEEKIKALDKNEDGFIHKTEVRIEKKAIGFFLTRTLHKYINKIIKYTIRGEGTSSWWNWNFENPAKKTSEKGENQQQTQATYGWYRASIEPGPHW